MMTINPLTTFFKTSSGKLKTDFLNMLRSKSGKQYAPLSDVINNEVVGEDRRTALTRWCEGNH